MVRCQVGWRQAADRWIDELMDGWRDCWAEYTIAFTE